MPKHDALVSKTVSEITLSAGEIPAAEPVSAEVVTAVADVNGVEPTELPPLYYAVDPDALDQLFPSHDERGAAMSEVRFTFAGCEVVVDGDDGVSVTRTDATSERDLGA